MKQLFKNISFLIIFFSISHYIYSQENGINIINEQSNESFFFTNYDFEIFRRRLLVDGGLRFLFPLVSSPYVVSFVNFGGGVGIDLVKYILSPGIYIDLGIGTDWFYIFSDSENKYDNYTPIQFLLSGGIRVYNYMRIFRFDVVPFLGYNFMVFFIPLPNIGVSIAFGSLAVEYAYYFPTNNINYRGNNMHHVMLKFSFHNHNNSWTGFFREP
jgi:hypothetical protein